MKYLFSKTLLSSRLAFAFLTFGLMVGLSACSNTSEKKNNSAQTINNQQTVEFGTVVAVRTVQLQENQNNPNNNPLSNVGIAASSGGFRGVYGSIDIGTLSRLFKNNSNPKMAQEIIVKKKSGETVVITQPIKESFKRGDSVKILVRNGYAQVVH